MVGYSVGRSKDRVWERGQKVRLMSSVTHQRSRLWKVCSTGCIIYVEKATIKSPQVVNSPWQHMTCTVLASGEVIPVWKMDETNSMLTSTCRMYSLRFTKEFWLQASHFMPLLLVMNLVSASSRIQKFILRHSVTKHRR